MALSTEKANIRAISAYRDVVLPAANPLSSRGSSSRTCAKAVRENITKPTAARAMRIL